MFFKKKSIKVNTTNGKCPLGDVKRNRKVSALSLLEQKMAERGACRKSLALGNVAALL